MALLTTEDVLNKKFQYVKFREGQHGGGGLRILRAGEGRGGGSRGLDDRGCHGGRGLGRRVHDEYVRDGEEQAAKIIADANAERDAIISDAQKQKDSLLSQLDQERELLENKINGLRTFEAEYRTNLRNHLETLLKEVDNGEN